MKKTMEVVLLPQRGYALCFTDKTSRILWDSTSFYPNTRDKFKKKQRVTVFFDFENLNNGDIIYFPKSIRFNGDLYRNIR